MANLKDSGDRREFDTGAVRDMAEGKGRMDLIPWNIALKIRGYMYSHYRIPCSELITTTLLDRFSCIEWCLSDGAREILEENFEMAAAYWIMFKYYYNDTGMLADAIVSDSDGLSDGTINRIWATAMLDVAKHFEDGARKYSDNNWRKGIPVWCYFDSASRHLMKTILAWNDEPHDRAVLWNLMCGAWTAANEPRLVNTSATVFSTSTAQCNANTSYTNSTSNSWPRQS